MIIMIAFVSMLAANCQLFWLLFQVTLLAGVLCTVAIHFITFIINSVVKEHSQCVDLKSVHSIFICIMNLIIIIKIVHGFSYITDLIQRKDFTVK